MLFAVRRGVLPGWADDQKLATRPCHARADSVAAKGRCSATPAGAAASSPPTASPSGP